MRPGSMVSPKKVDVRERPIDETDIGNDLRTAQREARKIA
jgi:hypothetical protein